MLNRKLIVPGDKTATLSFSVEHWIHCCESALKLHGNFAVALSGGSTPKAIYERLAEQAHASRVDWKKVLLFWSDERAVPPDSPESNYHMAMEAGFSKLPIPSSQIFRMRAEKEIEKEAIIYEELIKKTLGTRPFDLIMLGMGEDGHTASLFPNTQALKIEDKLIAANYVPQKNSWRMTMTFPCINASPNIALYLLGASKKEMLAEIFQRKPGSENLPAAQVGTAAHPALWIADKDAASLLDRK